ncbi:MAG: cell division protein ZapA, partial [Sphingomicrobium sp.]
MAALIDLNIGGRVYPVACREGEEETLQAAARLVDAKCRDAISGLGSLSESRQFMFAALLLADQLIDKNPDSAPPAPFKPDTRLFERAEALALSLE